MNIPDKIKKLTETFDYNLEMYKKGSYNETQVRHEFIDPFFEELGWDITNKQGLLAMTIPEKPTSSKQRYVKTETGNEVLKR